MCFVYFCKSANAYGLRTQVALQLMTNKDLIAQYIITQIKYRHFFAYKGKGSLSENVFKQGGNPVIHNLINNPFEYS